MNARPSRAPRLFALGLISAMTFACGCATSLKPDRTFEIDGLEELSGLACATEGGIFAVGDGGALADVSFDGRILRTLRIDGEDTEGVAVRPGGGEVALIGERTGHLIVVDLMRFELAATISLPVHPDRESDNEGYEGLRFLSRDRVLVVNQKPAVMFEFAIGDSHVKRTGEVALPADQVNDFLVSPDASELVLLSRDAGLRLVDRQGAPLSPWRTVAHDDLEAIELVAGRGLYLGADRKKSAPVFVFSHLRDWPTLRRALIEGGPAR